MINLGIMPAAGKASRFCGVMKELLPIGETSLMKRQLDNLLTVCQKVVVVTSPEKIAEHARHLEDYDNVFFAIQRDKRDAWGAILAGLQFEADRYFYAFPDTYIVGDLFEHMYNTSCSMYLFETDHPERFGVYKDGQIHDKCIYGGTHKAYGAMSWVREVRDWWLEKDKEKTIQTHTEAFNMAIKQFGALGFPIGKYYDIASWADYQRLVCDVL